MSREKVQGVLY